MVVDLNARRHMATHAQSKRGRQGKKDNAKLSLIKCPRTTKLRASLNRPGTERLGMRIAHFTFDRSSPLLPF